MEGTAPPTEEDILSSPLGKAQSRVQQLEENIARLQAVMNNFENQEEEVQNLDPRKHSKETAINAEFSTRDVTLKVVDGKLNEDQGEDHGRDMKMSEVCTISTGGTQENGEIPRKVLHAMEISIEKDTKTGATRVLSADAMTAAEFEGKDVSEVYRDGTKAIYTVGSQVIEQEMQLTPEMTEVILNQVKRPEGEPELLSKAKKQVAEIVNGLDVEEPSLCQEGKQIRESYEANTQEELSESNQLANNEDKLVLPKGTTIPDSYIKNIEVQRVGSEEENNVPVTLLQTDRSEVEVQKNSNVVVLQTDRNLNEMVPSLIPAGHVASLDTVTLTYNDHSDTNAAGAEDLFGTVLRAERVIIADDGEELSMDFDSDTRVNPIALDLESQLEKEKQEGINSEPTRPTQDDIKKFPTIHDVLSVNEQIHEQQTKGTAVEMHEELGTTVQNLLLQQGEPVPEMDKLMDKDQNSSVLKQNPSLQVNKLLSEEPTLLAVEREEVPMQLNPFLQDQHPPLQDKSSTIEDEKSLFEEQKKVFHEQKLIMQKEERGENSELHEEKSELHQETLSLQKLTLEVKKQENFTEGQKMSSQGEKLLPEVHKEVVHNQEQIVEEQNPPQQLEEMTHEENVSVIQELQAVQAHVSPLQGTHLILKEHKQVVFGQEDMVGEQKSPQQSATMVDKDNEPVIAEEEQALQGHASLLQQETLLPKEHVPMLREQDLDIRDEKASHGDTVLFHDQNLLLQKENLSGDEENPMLQEEEAVVQEQLPLLQERPEPTAVVLNANADGGGNKPETQPLPEEIKPTVLHSFQAAEPLLRETHLEPSTTSRSPAHNTASLSTADAVSKPVHAAIESSQNTEPETRMDGKQLAQPKQKTCQCCSVM
ncbi:titin-like isoform X2 [Protopterus annectens]|nr:titin-like isoform X2 [Protopterus annectens]